MLPISYTTSDVPAMCVTIRPCRPEDAETLVAMVRELAVYEHLESYARAKPEDFRAHLFGPRPAAEALLAEHDGAPVGFALYFSTFSTFRGQPGIYLEDLYVRPEYRGRGIGKALLAQVAGVAAARGCGQVGWAVLDWNAPAIGFYESLGAQALKEWTAYRIADEPLQRLARSASALADPQATGTTAG